jgi:hypothetical protein
MIDVLLPVVSFEEVRPAGEINFRRSSDAALQDLQNRNNQTLFHGPPDVRYSRIEYL